jgi:2'-hydroxyisoflavone reductase
MRILILGGTNFVGRTVAMEAVSRGHEVTTFNRGTKPTPEGAKAIVGDRLASDGYKGLDGLTFDSVLDTWSADPVAVRTAVAAIRGRISHFMYISSISVYEESEVKPPLTEESPVLDPATTKNKYGADKRGGELEAEKSKVRTLIARPGLILGPYEGISGRLPWWLGRMERGGKTLAPGPKDNGLQYIDARDLATFVVDAAEKCLGGVYNIISKPVHATTSELLETANTVVGGNAELVWIEPKVILDAGIAPWTELPCWLPPGPEHDLMMGCNVDKAFSDGLRARSLKETVADTWTWLQGQDEKPPIHGKNGLDPKKEAKLLS